MMNLSVSGTNHLRQMAWPRKAKNAPSKEPNGDVCYRFLHRIIRTEFIRKGQSMTDIYCLGLVNWHRTTFGYFWNLS